MDRKGFISVIALLVMVLIFMDIVFLLYMGNLQLSLSKFSTMNIKSNYMAEDMINRILYDKVKFNKYFRESIFRESRGYASSVCDSKTVKKIVKEENFDFCEFKIDKSSKKMNLNLISNCKDIKCLSKVYIDLVNDIFKIETPIVDINILAEAKREEFEVYLNSLEGIFDYEPRLDMEISGTNIFKYNIYNKAKILINDSNNKNILYDLENDAPKKLLEFTNHRLLLNIKNGYENNNLDSKLILGDKGDCKTMNFKGVLYVEGDLIINQNIDFEGVIVINNGNLYMEDGIKLKTKGMILYRGENRIDLDFIDYIYDKDTIYKYASYLPSYISPQIELIKKGNFDD